MGHKCLVLLISLCGFHRNYQILAYLELVTVPA